MRWRFPKDITILSPFTVSKSCLYVMKSISILPPAAKHHTQSFASSILGPRIHGMPPDICLMTMIA